jgi:biopolymer transport protein ExbD
MRFRQETDSNIPVIDLIPMLTVMMGVLAFFVVVSVSLGSEQIIQVDLPASNNNDPSTAKNDSQTPFVVEIDGNGQQLLNGQPIESQQLAASIQAYLSQNKENVIYLVPSRELPYEDVMQFLGDMRAVGGERVSLALDDTNAKPEASPSESPTSSPVGSDN